MYERFLGRVLGLVEVLLFMEDLRRDKEGFSSEHAVGDEGHSVVTVQDVSLHDSHQIGRPAEEVVEYADYAIDGLALV